MGRVRRQRRVPMARWGVECTDRRETVAPSAVVAQPVRAVRVSVGSRACLGRIQRSARLFERSQPPQSLVRNDPDLRKQKRAFVLADSVGARAAMVRSARRAQSPRAPRFRCERAERTSGRDAAVGARLRGSPACEGRRGIDILSVMVTGSSYHVRPCGPHILVSEERVH